MNYISEQEIRDIVSQVIEHAGLGGTKRENRGQEIPVEVSARHVHLTREALDVLYGKNYELTRKRDLSQPGQFLSEERIKLVTARGQIANVGILGPLRKEVQVELSMTDARTLGVNAPICLSGDLAGAADVLIVGPKGVVTAQEAAIVAKAHVHMTAADAEHYGVKDKEHVSICLGEERSLTLNDVIVRVSNDSALAVHIDYDEANAAQVGGGKIVGFLQKNR